MKIVPAPEVDILRIILTDVPIADSDEAKPGIIIDYGKDGNIVGFEVLDASQRVEKPRSVEYAVAAG